MQAIILAGGLGTRLQEVVRDIPKPMAPINGKPFLEIILNRLCDSGFQNVILAVSYKSEIIQGYFGNKFKSLNIFYSFEKKPLGTGGALKQALTLSNEEFSYILNGDTFLDLNFEDVEKKLNKNKKPIIVSRYVEDRSRYGSIVTDGDHISEFIEKGLTGPGLINSGCYVMPKQIFDDFLLEKFSFESDFLVNAVRKTSFVNFEHQGQFIDIGIPQDYIRAQHILTSY